MDLVVPIAGRSARFKDLTETPKWALKFGGDYILNLAIESVANEMQIGAISLVALEEHRKLVELVLMECKFADRVSDLYIKEPTVGQAESARRGMKNLSEGGFAIWNGDTFLLPNWLEGQKPSGNFFAVSRMEGDHWSFASIREHRVVQTAEKIPISEWASVGLYGWESQKLFLEALGSEVVGDPDAELFVAPLYNNVLNRNFVAPLFVRSGYVVCLGTPREIRMASLKFEKSVEDPFSESPQFRRFFA